MYSATSGGVLGFNNEVVSQNDLKGNQQLVGVPPGRTVAWNIC
jgi:hypothetical protein